VQHVLEDLRIEVVVLRPHLLDSRQLCRLYGTAHRDAAPLPGGCALLQSSVGELTAAPQRYNATRLSPSPVPARAWASACTCRFCAHAALLYPTSLSDRQETGNSWYGRDPCIQAGHSTCTPMPAGSGTQPVSLGRQPGQGMALCGWWGMVTCRRARPACPTGRGRARNVNAR
jgi:hypothetical protein